VRPLSELHPLDLTPDDRFRELASLLARGLVRLREQGPPAPPPAPHPAAKKPGESLGNDLESRAELRLSVHRG
jgi:hypothetical protein